MKSSIGFVFPGQGSQAIGMGQFLYNEFEVARDTFREASEAINIDLKTLCFTSSEAELSLTKNTQPALLTVSIATARVLTGVMGLSPSITAGHSIGEYSSLVIGNVLSFSDAVRAVRLRGESMQAAVPAGQGGMVATIGLTEDQVQFLCQWAAAGSGYGPLTPANYNCDGQIVISGNQMTLDWVKQNFKPEILPGEAKRVKLIPLQVSAPFHCDMMLPAQEKMANFLSQIAFKDSTLPIVQNVDARPQSNASTLKNSLIAQISAPVKWTHTMNYLKSIGSENLIECGHGAVLKGLFKKSDPEFFKVFSTNSMEDLKRIEQHFAG